MHTQSAGASRLLEAQSERVQKTGNIRFAIILPRRHVLSELIRQTAIKMEGIHVPTKPYPIVAFSDPNAIETCKIMSDQDMGGFSKVSMDFKPASTTEPAHAHFHGSISTELPPNRPEIQRSGYAAWRTRDRAATIFGKSLWDLDPYSYLALRIRSDGRKYFVNIQTESIVPTDLHQHRLYAKQPGEWETVVLSINEFVRTNHGMVVEPQKDMMRQRIRSVGIGLIDRMPGPFDISIAEIYATNDAGGEKNAKTAGVDTMAEPKEKEGEPEKILI